MVFSVKSWLDGVIGSRQRRAVPLLTSPGVELIGSRDCDVFRSGELQFNCIEALARRFPADLMVTFMDLSVEAEAFGCPVAFPESGTPEILAPVAGTAEAVEKLAVPAVGSGRTSETLKCARLCAERLPRPVLGGVIGPYSLAGRLADFTEMMMMSIAEPETAHQLLTKTSAFIREYVAAFKAAGLAGVVIAEPAAGLLSPEMCGEFSAAYLRNIVSELRDDSFMVVLHNCGNIERQVAELLSVGADALHVGNAVSITEILPQVPAGIPVMGNLDPVGVLRDGDEETVYRRTSELLTATASYPNYVLSSGCDVPPGVPLTNIAAFYRALEDFNRSLG